MTINVEFWKRIQQEHEEWQLRNFGHQEPWKMLLGIVEENGELADAKTPDEIDDAIGDTFIFFISFCTANGFDMGDIVEAAATASRDSEEEVTSCLGRLAHHTLKLSQGIRGGRAEHTAALQAECSRLFGALGGSGGQAESLVQAVWDKVKTRDWKKDARNG